MDGQNPSGGSTISWFSKGLRAGSKEGTKGKLDHFSAVRQSRQLRSLDHFSRTKKSVAEAKSIIKSLDTHRVISPYAGWFAKAPEGATPSVTKQTMLVLLVLFPIVMLELKYLPLLTGNLNPSLGMFIGNAISVTLISWPMMPLALFFLGWWLKPNWGITLLGALILIVLYLIEIAIFWNLI